jgi:hypothetical protein
MLQCRVHQLAGHMYINSVHGASISLTSSALTQTGFRSSRLASWQCNCCQQFPTALRQCLPVLVHPIMACLNSRVTCKIVGLHTCSERSSAVPSTHSTGVWYTPGTKNIGKNSILGYTLASLVQDHSLSQTDNKPDTLPGRD